MKRTKIAAGSLKAAGESVRNGDADGEKKEGKDEIGGTGELAVRNFEDLAVRRHPAVEIVAPGGFYDFSAKYEKGKTQYLCPAPLSAAVTKESAGLSGRVTGLTEVV